VALEAKGLNREERQQIRDEVTRRDSERWKLK